MKRYTVKKGSHDFKPNDQTLFSFNRKLTFECRLTESMWFSREDPDYDGGNDVEDINKLCGITNRITGNNSQSAIIGWRPNEKEKNSFEIVAYINHRNKSFHFEHLGYFKAGEDLEGFIRWSYRKVSFAIKRKGEKSQYLKNLNLKRPFLRGEIGAWFGGNRAAHKDMELYMKTNFPIL